MENKPRAATNSQVAFKSKNKNKNMQKELNFGQALEAVKQGKLIAREGWNGKGMFVFMRPSDVINVETIINNIKSISQTLKNYYKSRFAHTIDEEADVQSPKDIKVTFTAYLCMLAADGSIVNGWLASQTDMLANDWCILDLYD